MLYVGYVQCCVILWLCLLLFDTCVLLFGALWWQILQILTWWTEQVKLSCIGHAKVRRKMMKWWNWCWKSKSWWQSNCVSQNTTYFDQNRYLFDIWNADILSARALSGLAQSYWLSHSLKCACATRTCSLTGARSAKVCKCFCSQRTFPTCVLFDHFW